MTRRNNILEYMSEWRDGYWNLGETPVEEVPAKVAEEVIAWEDLSESSTNMKVYAAEFTSMLEDGTLEYVTSGSGSLQLVIAER